ncbi:hypothetical protein D3C75_1318400 [compost metagenome]
MADTWAVVINNGQVTDRIRRGGIHVEHVRLRRIGLGGAVVHNEGEAVRAIV